MGVESTSRGDLLAEAYRLQGLFLLRQSTPAPAQAEGCFQQAVTIARRQGARSWELRAATSLAQLWHHRWDAVDARAMLGPVYNWFTEEFDTADLQDAQRLLAMLD